MTSNTNEHPTSVLFVCLGNICRSPMAEGVFRNLAATHPSIGEIDSAGTAAYHSLEPPDSRTMSTLRRHKITGYDHAARKVTREDFLTFDYLLAMDKSNLRDLEDVRDSKVAEVRLFGDFGKGGKLHERVGGGEVVKDPYYGGANGFEEVYQQVTRFSQNFMEYLEQNRSDSE
ncbi:Pc20g05050 [Penicillium rubens Wisconsin 54-1255]|uniref:Pc20g05050 protein n=1 Tax=Penicillium rubens (strain ATCC 28089 / DSM 1075 / NRRL 1951 / Wisconsin 54-1255) TaxID=500485 RepID=B6HEC9_PENRW|nr:Pc20g05050 [Penicillium rubens Wisconsin 54-1255]